MSRLFQSEVLKSSNENSAGLLLIQPNLNSSDPLDWAQQNKRELLNEVLTYGAVLLRGLPVNSISDFNKVSQIFCPNRLDYTYRSTPRTRLGGKVYTATEYPKERSIPLHNENSYSNNWPQTLMFYSAIVATKGGETPLADSRSVYKKIDPSIRDAFEKKKVLYVRNYHENIDLSWNEVFQTDDPNKVAEYCEGNSIDYEWHKQSPELTTKQVCQASLRHPITKEKVWFNQAHLFHISALNPVDRALLETEIGMNFPPRNAFYGNGESIDSEVLNHIREVYETEKIKFKWQKGDILIVDNLLMAHGREPFEGERKVAVTMGS